MEFRRHFGYDVEEASNSATIKDSGESLTVQSQSEDADINVMMKRFGVTGKMPDNPRVPVYGDFSGVNDFASALRVLTEAQDNFMEFPASVRSRFDNDPQKLLEFCADSKNADEAEKMGLFSKDVVERREKDRQAVREAAEKAAQEAMRAKILAERGAPSVP